MILFALESSAGLSSVAVWRDTKILAHQFIEAKYGHAERIVSQADAAIEQAEIDLGDIDFFLGGRGPGSFTGIRTCLAAITGYSIVANRQCYGVNGLSALGFGCVNNLIDKGIYDEKTVVLALSDTRRGSFYCQKFSQKKINPDDIEDLTLTQLHFKINSYADIGYLVGICGPFSEKNLEFKGNIKKPEQLYHSQENLDATNIAQYGAWQIQNDKKLSPATPLYLTPAKTNKTKIS